MHRRLAAAIGTALAAGVLALPAHPALAATNLVANPGLETGNLSGWTCSQGSVVTSPVHSGSFALAGAVSDSDTAQCAQTVAVQPNQAYTLSAWVRGAYVFIGVTGGASTWTPSATSYSQLTVPFTTGASTTSVQVFVHGWYAQGGYNADDVSLTGPGGTVLPPAAPTGLAVTAATSSSVSLSWTGSAGATGYNVYRNGTRALTGVAGTSATVSGLAASTTSTFTVSATNSAGESPQSAGVQGTTTSGGGGGGGGGSPRAWPYIDITFSTPTLADVARATGQKFFTLAFVLGDSTGCNPSWGGTTPLGDARIAGEIRDLRALGGDVAVSFGGAQAPYLQAVCGTVASQATAYERVVDLLGITHLDFDIEASVPLATMNQAIARVQHERSGIVVSYTLEIQSDDFGLTPALGVDVLTNAKANGVNVGIVNPMTMDFGSSRPWGDAVIAAATSTLGQMAQIWPEKSSADLHRMLGVTPMIGRNDTGPIFTQANARQLVTWANGNHIGQLGFWSVGRDNGGCPNGGVSPTCSSISQTTFEFTGIFGGFTG
jgi:hypothetical protein